MKSKLSGIYLLHILNDGFSASILLFLPFIAQDLGFNLTKVGFLGSALNVLGVVLALPAGYLAYKFGGYKLLLTSLLIYSLGYLGISVSPVFLFIVASFLLAGVGFGMFHTVAFAEVAKNSEKTVRGKHMGNFTAVGDLGRIGLSSLVTFIIVYIGWRSTSLIFALVGVLIFGVLIFLVKRNGDKLEKPKNKHKKV